MLIILINLAKKVKEKIPIKESEKNELILNYVYDVYKDICLMNKLFKMVYG